MIEARNLIAKIATNNDEIEACKRLRHRIFLRGLNEGIGDSEKGVKLDEDIYDSLAEHIILIDKKRLCKGLNNYAVGTCRLIVGGASDGPNHFYSNSEFVIDSLVKSRNLFLEVGRSCVDHEYRDGLALYLLWLTLLKYLENKKLKLFLVSLHLKETLQMNLITRLVFCITIIYPRKLRFQQGLKVF